MSLTNLVNSVQYTLDGATLGPYNITFPFYDNTHIVVTVNNAGVFTTLVLNTDYTLTGAAFPATGGTLMLAAAQNAFNILTISRVVPLTQLTAYALNDRFPSTSHERQMDLMAMMGQQLLAAITNLGIRCGQAVIPDGQTSVNIVFSTPLPTQYYVVLIFGNGASTLIYQAVNQFVTGFTITVNDAHAGHNPNWLVLLPQ